MLFRLVPPFLYMQQNWLVPISVCMLWFPWNKLLLLGLYCECIMSPRLACSYQSVYVVVHMKHRQAASAWAIIWTKFVTWTVDKCWRNAPTCVNNPPHFLRDVCLLSLANLCWKLIHYYSARCIQSVTCVQKAFQPGPSMEYRCMYVLTQVYDLESCNLSVAPYTKPEDISLLMLCMIETILPWIVALNSM